MLFTADSCERVAQALSHLSGTERLQTGRQRLTCKGISVAVPLEQADTSRRSGKR